MVFTKENKPIPTKVKCYATDKYIDFDRKSINKIVMSERNHMKISTK